MGGWMTYQRMRGRNNLMYRKPDDDPDPYWRGDAADAPPLGPDGYLRHGSLIGDMNRMERDYLNNDDPFGGLSGAVARATGVRDDHVLRVLRYIFLEQP
jgi:hypothetical protein